VGTNYEKNISEVMLKGESISFEWKGRYSNEVWEINVLPFEGGVIVSSRDVTKRKKAEEALKENEKRLNRSQEIAHLGSWELDLVKNQLVWSDEVYRIFGLKPQEFGATYQAFLDSVHPDDRAAVDAAYSGSLRENKDTYEIEHRVLRKSTGEIRFVHEKCEHIRDASGKIVASVGMVHDITERRKAEEEKVVSEKSYRRLFETSQDGIMARDLEGGMIDCNQAYSKMIGYSKQELKNLSANELLPEKWREHREKIIKGVLATGGSVVFEREYRRRDGVVFPASVRTWRLTDEKGNVTGTWSMVRDITLQKELQENLQRYTTHLEQLVEERTRQLKDSERLAAIGATAGMVGHDIRNPLQAIVSDVYLLKSELDSMPEGEERKIVEESLDGIEKNIDYINKIIADLQDFARPLNPKAEETDLKLVINDLLKKNSLPENVKVKVKVEGAARKVAVDSTFINRILSNLVTNAVQAMPKGGEVTIHAYKKENDYLITVIDTGVGIPEAVKSKLFMPMFTTKSKGQGFGLSVVKRMTESLGGTVSFESTEGKGTTFTVRLPPQTSKGK
jgi:PAS domain S-box-containing protein